MQEVHYCTNCMKKSVLDMSERLSCPECGADNFLLLRAGQIGTHMTMDQYGINGDSFEWASGHQEAYDKIKSGRLTDPNLYAAMSGVASRIKKAIEDKDNANREV